MERHGGEALIEAAMRAVEELQGTGVPGGSVTPPAALLIGAA